MKRIFALIICALISVSVFSGCNSNVATKSGKLNIVTTIFPIYDWVKNIAGDKADVTLLIDNGVDVHSFQPSAQDIVKISTCDMFVYVGGESDSWVEDALSEKVNKDMTAVNLMEELRESVKEEEHKEGMQGEKPDEKEYDEHIWLSLRNAEKACDTIYSKLKEKDKANKKIYDANKSSYINKLNALDKKFSEAVNNSKTKTMVFGDRFPLRYFADDYKIRYFAAFSGCSAETEASFKTIAFLAGKVDEYKLNSIFTIETSDGKIAETIKNNTKTKNQKILIFNSMQSISSKDIKNKVTYLSVMEDNLKTIKQGL